jgi:branched-chain amino acid transport system ATP-binding protein
MKTQQVSTRPIGKTVLELENVSKNFSGIQALSDIHCCLEEGQIHGLIGPNGSGKSTFFNIVSGTLPVSGGQILLQGNDITHQDAVRISRLGIARTFQGGLVVPTLTCLENVMLGVGVHVKRPLLGTMLSSPFRARRKEKQARDRAASLLARVGLNDSTRRLAGELVWVERQKLQIARAMASDPTILLLDEPTAGMGEHETEEVEALVRLINKDGVTIMLVSHDVGLVARLSNRITVLTYGKKISEGAADTVLADPLVREAYLGA